jgi:hypothetical protein
MNNDERASLLFLHNGFLAGHGHALAGGGIGFSMLRPDPEA